MPCSTLLGEAAVSHEIVLTKADQMKPAELAACIDADRGGVRAAPRRISGRARHLVALGPRHPGAARGNRPAAGGTKLTSAERN